MGKLIKGNSYGTFSNSDFNGKRLQTDGCIVLICTAGCAVVTINFMRYKFRRGDVAIVLPDMFFTPLSVSKGFEVRYMAFSENTMEQAYFKMISNIFWDFLYSYPIVTPDEQNFRLITEWWESMRWVCGLHDDTNREAILSNSIYNLFLAYDSVISIDDNAKELYTKDRAWVLFGKFTTLIVKHCRHNREVKFYAKKMCITPDYLYKITNKVMKLTPKELIDMQVAFEIKTYLTETDLTIKYIADKLGFEDPSYMCRFFRRLTGMSTREFKQTSQ
ncbi:MAG: AraC family transcriptional regulator [Muribaculum sp.]|nr:AraC family transcriptional regulator [Muribaculum sp.]